MADEVVKIDDETIEIQTPKVEARTYDYQFLVTQEATLVAELQKVRDLIAEFKWKQKPSGESEIDNG